MPRSTPEWIGKTDDAKIPPRVRQRVFDRDDGICCECKLAIKPGETWQADHRIALINGGEHRESNLAPIHSHCHVGKTAEDVKEKARIAKIRGRHIGAIRPKGTIPQRPKPAKPEPKPSLAPRAMFWRVPETQREEIYDAE